MLRRIALVCVAIATILPAGCTGGGRSRRGPDDHVSFSGEVMERGSTPFALITVESANGRIYLIQSSDLADELRRLVGMRVFINGRLLRTLDDAPVVDVVSYDLEPLPSGERPIIGRVRSGGWIIDDNDVLWKLEGDFGDILTGFAGSKVWVVGVTLRSVNTASGSYRVIDVTEYGLIR